MRCLCAAVTGVNSLKMVLAVIRNRCVFQYVAVPELRKQIECESQAVDPTVQILPARQAPFDCILCVHFLFYFFKKNFQPVGVCECFAAKAELQRTGTK